MPRRPISNWPRRCCSRLGSVEATVAYAERIGNIPARKDAADRSRLPDADRSWCRSMPPPTRAPSSSRPPASRSSPRASPAPPKRLLRKETDAAGAQQILVDYVKETARRRRGQIGIAPPSLPGRATRVAASFSPLASVQPWPHRNASAGDQRAMTYEARVAWQNWLLLLPGAGPAARALCIYPAAIPSI